MWGRVRIRGQIVATVVFEIVIAVHLRQGTLQQGHHLKNQGDDPVCELVVHTTVLR